MNKDKRYKFPYSNEELAEKVNSILEEYDVPLTLRQVYYRLVALGLKNAQKVYQNLSGKLSRLREDGLVPWDKIVDLNRQPKKISSWTSPAEFFENDRGSYKRDLQQGQEKYLEVWCEKAVAISHITNKYDVHLLAGGGYRSSSALYEAAERFRDIGKPVVILYLGDWDPSGLDIERDVEIRIREIFGIEVDVQRVLLVHQDITDYKLEPNQAKPADPRAYSFIEQYGKDTYELDALPPDIIAKKLEAAIVRNMNMDLYEIQVEKGEEDEEVIEKFIDAWNERESY